MPSLPEAVYQYSAPFLSPVTYNLLFLNQLMREFICLLYLQEHECKPDLFFRPVPNLFFRSRHFMAVTEKVIHMFINNAFSLYNIPFFTIHNSYYCSVKYTERQKSCTTNIFANFSQIEISFEILNLILTYVYKSLYFKVCPSNFPCVVLSLQLKLEKQVFCTRAVLFHHELKYFCIFLTVRV